MTKEDFPKTPEQLDGWLAEVSKFNRRFEVLLRGIVYLYGVRDQVNTNDLENMTYSVKETFRHACESNCKRHYNPDNDECQSCPFGERIKELMGGDER